MTTETIDYGAADALVGQPGWLVRWGNLAFLIAIAAVLAAAAFVPYPDAIKGKAAIASDPPPALAVARSAGTLTILVADGAVVAKQQPVAVVETTASLDAVRSLRAMIAQPVAAERAYPALRIGELQTPYATFLEAMNRWRDLVDDTHSAGSEMELALEVDYAERQSLADAAQLASLEAKASLTKSAHDRTRALFDAHLVSKQDVERAEAALLDARSAIESGRAGKAMSATRVTRYRQALVDVRHDRALQLAQRGRAAEEARLNLLAQLDQWEALHVVTAPHAGRVWFLPAAIHRQHVAAEQPVMMVLPVQWQALARVDVPLYRSGDIVAGQKVLVELAEYGTEYPPLEGTVRRVSPMARDGRYVVDAELVTDSKKLPPLKPGMTGSARIVTRDRSMLARLFDRILTEETSK